MKIIYRFCIVLIILIIFFAFVGCDFIGRFRALDDNYRKENIIDYSTPYYSGHNFFNKVILNICSPEQKLTSENYDGDYLEIRIDDEHGNICNYEKVLSGLFERYTYVKGELIIYMGEQYYVFDIDEFQPKNASASKLQAYSSDEFERNYPSFGDFDWKVQ